jgi:hypothetical protein
MQTTCPQIGDTVELAAYPGQRFECLGFDQNGIVVAPLRGSGLVTNAAGMLATPAGAPAGATPEADLRAYVTTKVAESNQKLDFTLELITTLGHNQGQLDLWSNLYVGAPIPPGYGGGERGRVSYEMLNQQIEAWRVARDLTFNNLVQQGANFANAVVGALLALSDYLLGPTPDKAFAQGMRDQLGRLAEVVNELAKITGDRLALILTDYREQLKRVDLGLGKLGIAPLKVPEGAGFGLMVLAVIAAVAFGFSAGR